MQSKTGDAKRERSSYRTVLYVVEIEEWGWDFMFGRLRTDMKEPLSEHRQLELRGTLIGPSEFKASEIELLLLPSHRLNRDKDGTYEIDHVGTLDVRQKKFACTLTLPLDAMDACLQMAAVERLRFVVLHGEKLYRRHAHIHHYRFTTRPRHDPEDVAESAQMKGANGALRRT